ncbi:SMP-30/gluconolactonase/LRE family protein [Thalassotalea sp. HSM 43]|uniref:SMP-30/gluconolactonase/LRE family protein n=1 Tax=Thalassotalea sp. HSM 43 TaxID=2552945 RepID=UPI001081E9AA|nr:SMP-30/gluconolactonase/LRE family protein [Thalassotalea sp. HSM 43]QBY04232.1 SMP-30/gluconolactonase/LRE family protein [Thalassotalea sp. HSM 43]
MANVKVGKLLLEIEVTNTLAEGVQWHPETESIWWTDIEGLALYSFHLPSKSVIKHSTPYRVGCFAFIENDPRLLVAFEQGIAFYQIDSQEVQWLAKPEAQLPTHRFNDGRVDRQGRFWAGTMLEDQSLSTRAGLYKYSAAEQAQKMIDDVLISNGLCWSPCSNVMYHADSPKHEIYRYQFEPISGEIKHKSLFAQTAQNCFPDGSTVDSQGFLWNAQWGGSKVVRYAPDGRIDMELFVPVSQPSCVAFAGTQLDLLVVTSARQGLSAEQIASQPKAGNLFIYQLHGIHGLAESKFVLPA